MATVTPGNHTHEQWLGLVQPVGLVVAPAVLSALQLFPNQSTPYLSARQRQLEGLLEEVEPPGCQPLAVVPSFELLSAELLDWGDADLVAASELASVPEVMLAEYGETLRPTHGVPKFEGEGLQALVLDLTQWRDSGGKPDPQWGRDFDANWNPTGHGWDATPQQRFERLLKETEIPIGLLFNGRQLRLIHAPRGESSGWLTMPLEPMAEVAGRPMLGALELLLGVDRLFGGNPEQRLPALLAASRKNQNEVSTRLAEQVLEALWELLLGFDEAERIAREAGGTVLGELPRSEEGQKNLYGGLITVLLRLVFLLYAEDEALMPKDSLYGQHYSVSALADRLRQERFEHQGAMADRRGAWASLLSLFRLVYDGGGADPNYLPARHGDLFDPDTYPFLEGRDPGSHYTDDILTNVPSISDDVVEKVLTRLLWLADESKVAQRLNYRSLDVEQIGSVYEGIMGFTVEGATGPSIGITYRPSRQKITITLVVDAEQLLAVGGGKREKWLDEQAGVALKLPAKVKEGLKQASSLAELCLCLGNRLSPHTPNGVAPGSLILQPTAERRRSGSHYTPRALTEPIVAEAFRPWLERCGGKPTAKQILDLKVCDPAMGSGAFLVAVCRYLAGWLVQAWDNGDPHKAPTDSSLDKDLVARRLIAQSCLYGVDKNPFAVNLAKLSLWLVTLSKELPFTFVDHALKSGDSLVGYSVKEIQSAMQEVQLGFLNEQNQIYAGMGIARRESFADDSLDDEAYDRKKVLLQQQIKASEGLRQAGDLMVAAFFDASRPKERADKQQVYLAMLSGAFQDDALNDSVQEIRDRLAAGEKGIRPFHWDLEFPEVFGDGRDGFDAFVGNPPFAGKNTIVAAHRAMYTEHLLFKYPGTNGKSDLVAFFFRKAFEACSRDGSFSLISTNTISQGDTRQAGLAPIRAQGGIIYSAMKRIKWPGVAAVEVNVVSIAKMPQRYIEPRLNKKPVKEITAFLFSKGCDMDPERLSSNSSIGFQGCNISGQGFLFCDTTKGAWPIEKMRQILATHSEYQSVLRRYIGGEDLNSSPTYQSKRFVISLGAMPLAVAEEKYPELVALLRASVKPDRESRPINEQSAALARKWWQWHTERPSLWEAAKHSAHLLACSSVSTHLAFGFLPKDVMPSYKLSLFTCDSMDFFAVIQSRAHEIWSRFFSSTLEDRLSYSITDSFETFCFPSKLVLRNGLSEEGGEQISILEQIGARYYEFRAELMVRNNEGLTSTYNRFHDPSETSPDLHELRRLHSEMDQAVLQAYGWSDVTTTCGFGLDYLDLEDDVQLPDDLQERIDGGDLFFWDANDALDFQAQLRATGAVKSSRRLPWRYRWPDAVRDDVLALLLALNAERHEEEVALGLHTKAGKQAAKASGKRKKKTTSAPEFQLANEPFQTGLNLF